MKLKNSVLTILIVFSAFITLNAQPGGLKIGEGLILIDEFGSILTEDFLARADNFTISLNANPDRIGIIMISGNNSGMFSESYKLAATFNAYFADRKYNAPRERIQIKTCDVTRKGAHSRLYIADRTAKIPECDTSLPKFDKTAQFGVAYFTTGEYLGCCEIVGVEEEMFKAILEATMAILEAAPKSKVMLIGYSGTNNFDRTDGPAENRTLTRKPRKWDSPSVVNGKLRDARSFFAKQKISTDRIDARRGGYRNGGSEVEIWIIPEGGAKPEIKPVYKITRRPSRKGR